MTHRAILKTKWNALNAVFFLLLGTAGFFYISGCDLFEPKRGPVVAVIGDQRLTADVLKKDMLFVSEDLPLLGQDSKQIKIRLLDLIIDRYLIMAYAGQQGIVVDEKEFQKHLNEIKNGYTESEFEQTLLEKYGDPSAWTKRLREQFLIRKVVETVTRDIESPAYEEIKSYFESNLSQFKTPDMVKFRQIVCRTRAEAKELHVRLRAGENMAQLAREHSLAPEAENGGEVGWIMQGTLDKAIEKQLFSLAPGEISQLTKGHSGYHIFEVISRRSAGFQAFSVVIRDIEGKLMDQKRAAFCKQWLKNLRGDITVEINQKAIDNLEFS